MQAAITDGQITQLIPACQRGEAGAIEQLYDLYGDRIYRYLLARTGDADAASDLTTEVFLRVLEHVGHFRLNEDRPAASFSAWLYRVAGNLVSDYRRRQRRQPAVTLDEDLELSSDAPDPLTVAVKREEAARLADALDRLTEDQRQALIARYTEGMSNRQIATWLRKTEGAVEALQHRALRTLGRILGAGVRRDTDDGGGRRAAGVARPQAAE